VTLVNSTLVKIAAVIDTKPNRQVDLSTAAALAYISMTKQSSGLSFTSGYQHERVVYIGFG